MAIPCVAEPEEITRLVLFVASDEASFSTGSEFIVDGGVRWDPCRSMNAPTRPWPASFRITSCHPCGTSVTLGPISTWRTAGAMGEHVGVVGANRLPEVAGPAWGPSACQRAPLVQPADSYRARRFRGRCMSSGEARPPNDFRT